MRLIELLREPVLELLCHFGTDLEAATSDCGTNCGDQILWIATAHLGHFAHSQGDDTRCSALPPCVDCPNAMIYGIGQKDGDAVGGADAHPFSGLRRDDGVRLRSFRSPTFGRHYHQTGMNLPDPGVVTRPPAVGCRASSETMLQPRRLAVEQRRPVDGIQRIAPEAQEQAFFWLTTTCSRNRASISSDSRTSVGRRTSVLMPSILS